MLFVCSLSPPLFSGGGFADFSQFSSQASTPTGSNAFSPTSSGQLAFLFYKYHLQNYKRFINLKKNMNIKK